MAVHGWTTTKTVTHSCSVRPHKSVKLQNTNMVWGQRKAIAVNGDKEEGGREVCDWRLGEAILVYHEATLMCSTLEVNSCRGRVSGCE